ncbi:MAG: bifunctional folylpolyglutamate synthase/dihydrofolate synthase [Muribaculaceae bacterium]|nr:bifunctional folylpolyglutamate synthase/dihydrofolate synthase [Muribaculaceae bacterium]
MDYQETLDYLFTQTPMFQSIGAGAYKPGLQTVERLSEMFGNQHKKFKTIHVGGTNGKGSTAHTIAAVLQSAGYKVGLFTSPHLVDFRERIRVNGEMISEGEVCDFVDRFIASGGERLNCSFFELTTVMAFEHFAKNEVDIAVIEVGLGGRLDSTNIITPELSVITNISLDHTALLGHTHEEIAKEKAGIIKDGVPVIIGESDGKVREVFAMTAEMRHAPICYADDSDIYTVVERLNDYILYKGTPWGDIRSELCGDCQTKNAATIMCALLRLGEQGFNIGAEAVAKGFANVCELTGLAGRWMKVGENPSVICDTGHNIGGWRYLAERLRAYGNKLHMVIGFVNDKDVSGILAMMPREAHYHFVRPSVPRGLDAEDLSKKAADAGLKGSVSPSVEEGYKIALSQAKEGDTIFVGGSTFVVADLMSIIG